MRQQATVECATDDYAIITVLRESACSGDCHKCAGCGAVKQALRIRAKNPIGARNGDCVYVESSTATVLWAAVLVYLMPVVGFFGGYFLGLWMEHVGLMATAGFFLGWLPALWYNAYVKRRPPVYTLVGFADRD